MARATPSYCRAFPAHFLHVRRGRIAGDCTKFGQHLQGLVVVEEIAGCNTRCHTTGAKQTRIEVVGKRSENKTTTYFQNKTTTYFQNKTTKGFQNKRHAP